MSALLTIEPIEYVHVAVGALAGALLVGWAQGRKFDDFTVVAAHLVASLGVGIVAVAQLRWPQLPLWGLIGFFAATTPLRISRRPASEAPSGSAKRLGDGLKAAIAMTGHLAACASFAVIGFVSAFSVALAFDWFT